MERAIRHEDDAVSADVSPERPIVSYATLMAHLELGESNAGLLRIVGDLAQRFRARVIGIATCQPIQMALGDGYFTGEVVQQDLEEIGKEITAAEAEFRSTLRPGTGALEWRSAISFTPLHDFLAQEARSADLVITKLDRNASLFDSSRHVNIGDLVMKAGRPVLIVPAEQPLLTLGHVLLAWKETSEARRAALDALPMLELAGRVTIVEIAAAPELEAAAARLADVAVWLKGHGIAAEPMPVRAAGDDASQLGAIARHLGVDVIVAGVYGHSRLREWVLGGVTRELLLKAGHCALVSH
jgi:nucleotide-binding universal stress UspA family protein